MAWDRVTEAEQECRRTRRVREVGRAESEARLGEGTARQDAAVRKSLFAFDVFSIPAPQSSTECSRSPASHSSTFLAPDREIIPCAGTHKRLIRGIEASFSRDRCDSRRSPR